MSTTNASPFKNNTLVARRRVKVLLMAGMMILLLLGMSTLAVYAPSPGPACADWESEGFWRQATKQEVDNCIEQGIVLENSLHWAARWNENPDVLSTLIEAGAEVNARNGSDETPLHWAARWNKNPDIISTLIEAGAEVGAGDGSDETPLRWAARWNKNLDIISTLIEAGAKLHTRCGSPR